jgi:hypothetical protein
MLQNDAAPDTPAVLVSALSTVPLVIAMPWPLTTDVGTKDDDVQTDDEEGLPQLEIGVADVEVRPEKAIVAVAD